MRHGRIWGGRDTIAALATDLACNAYGSEEIGRLIEPLLAKAVAAEGFVLLPRQEQPVVMNTKGASASGKSTLRPRQKKLAGDIGVRWSEFALISPDIWRKQLLDYGTLGPAYKYGGAFTGEELQIVDQKLDRYMARKAERGEMTHLLIDRFRFDSFAPDSDEAGSNLLTRFGHSVYLFFMITPPESLVERAWKRGLEVGRYKAVDDTLGHGVEAYSGMPQLFFTWVQRADKRVHFEFLDNSVPLGERPRTVAFGSNDSLNVLDVGRMLDVERFRRVNVDATIPGAAVSRCRSAAAGAQRGISPAVRGTVPRSRFRGSGDGPHLSLDRCRHSRLVRPRRAGTRHRGRRNAGRHPCRRARRDGPRPARRPTGPATSASGSAENRSTPSARGDRSPEAGPGNPARSVRTSPGARRRERAKPLGSGTGECSPRTRPWAIMRRASAEPGRARAQSAGTDAP